MMIFLIALAGFLIKLPFLFKPMAGYFASYQVVNAMMTEMMLTGQGIESLLIPRTFLLINEIPAMHLLYYPFASLISAGMKFLFGGTAGFWGKLQASLFMLAAAVMLYRLVRKHFSEKIALMSACVFTFSPMVLSMGISFQNEAFAVAFLLASLLFAHSRNVSGVLLSGLLFSAVLTARLHFVVLYPVLAFAVYSENKSYRKVLYFTIAALSLVCAWYGFVYRLEQVHGDIIQTSFFSQLGEGRLVVNPIWKSAAFYEQIFDSLVSRMVTPVCLPFLILGILNFSRPQRFYLLCWIFSWMTVLILPQKVNDHSFYLIHAIPAASVLTAIGLEKIAAVATRWQKTVFFLLFFIFAMRYYIPIAVSDWGEGKRIQDIGKHLQTVTGPDDFLVAQHGSSPDLLYYSNRFGYDFDLKMEKSGVLTSFQPRHLNSVRQGYGDPIRWIEKLRSSGADYFVISESDLFRGQEKFYEYMISRYELYTQDLRLGFMIFDLKKEKT